MTRGKQLTSESIKRIIDELNLPDSAKRRIEQLSPRRYVGDAKKTSRDLSREIIPLD